MQAPVSSQLSKSCQPTFDKNFKLAAKSELSFFWGASSPCKETAHVEPDGDTLTLDRFRWVHLGNTLEPASCRLWLYHTLRSAVYAVARRVDWDSFVLSLKVNNESELEEHGYVIKLPYVTEPLSVATEDDLARAMVRLNGYLHDDHRFWCQRPPPVILVCTSDQAAKYHEQGWEDSVALEYDALHPASPTPDAGHAGELADSGLSMPEARNGGVQTGRTDCTPAVNRRMVPPSSNDDVIVLEDDPVPEIIDLGFEDGSSAERPIVLGDDEGEVENDQVSKELGNMILMARFLEDRQVWDAACEFFLHDPSDETSGIRLPGMRTHCHPYQFLDVYKALSVCRRSDSNGMINCSKPGLGKSFETIIVCCTIVLSHLCKEDVEANPDAHGANDNTCALSHPFGIKCYCVAGSLAREICQRTQGGPQLWVMPSALKSQWIKEVRKWLSSTVVLSNGTVLFDEPLLLLTTYSDGKLCSLATEPGQPGQKTVLAAKDLVAQVHCTGSLSADLGGSGVNTNIYNTPMNRSTSLDPKGTFQYTTEYPPRASGLPAWKRCVIIASTQVISRGSLDRPLSTVCLVNQIGKKERVRLKFTLAINISVLVYDEFTEGKSEDSNVIQTLRLLIRAHKRNRPEQRAFTLLLSGTPIEKGPEDMLGIYPMIRMGSKASISATLKELQGLYQQARRQAISDPSRQLEETVKAINEWQEASTRVFGIHMFRRELGGRLLEGTLPDPRPPARRHDPEFMAISPQHAQKLSLLDQSLRSYASQQARTGNTAEAQLDKLSGSRPFNLAHRGSIVPGLTCLGIEELNALANDVGKNERFIVEKIADMECAQLTRISEIVLQDCDEGKIRHGFVFTTSPILALVVFHWLRHDLGNQVQVENFTSLAVPAGKRAREMERIRRDAMDPQMQKRVVVVSTFGAAAIGLDGAQAFCTYVIKLGEPWVNKSSEQAENRVHRPGQKKTTSIYSIHGAENSLDYDVVQKNLCKTTLLSQDGVLAQFLH